jgi:hypothetical protein
MQAEKERVADEICQRLEALLPGLRQAITFRWTGGLVHGGMHERLAVHIFCEYAPTKCRLGVGCCMGVGDALVIGYCIPLLLSILQKPCV